MGYRWDRRFLVTHCDVIVVLSTLIALKMQKSNGAVPGRCWTDGPNLSIIVSYMSHDVLVEWVSTSPIMASV